MAQITPETPVTFGNLLAALSLVLQQANAELLGWRQFREELEAWFGENPKISEAFGAFQEKRRGRAPKRARRK